MPTIDPMFCATCLQRMIPNMAKGFVYRPSSGPGIRWVRVTVFSEVGYLYELRSSTDKMSSSAPAVNFAVTMVNGSALCLRHTPAP